MICATRRCSALHNLPAILQGVLGDFWHGEVHWNALLKGSAWLQNVTFLKLTFFRLFCSFSRLYISFLYRFLRVLETRILVFYAIFTCFLRDFCALFTCFLRTFYAIFAHFLRENFPWFSSFYVLWLCWSFYKELSGFWKRRYESLTVKKSLTLYAPGIFVLGNR